MAKKSVQRTLHAIDIHLLTAEPPADNSDNSLRRWALGLARDLTVAINPILWQTAVDSVARSIASGPPDLNLTSEQAAEVARWLRAQERFDEI